jgi:hypothetical protein
VAGLDLAAVRPSDFRALVGEEFVLAVGGGVSFGVELVAVEVHPGASDHERPFAVVFAGGPNPPLPQSIRRLTHPSVAELDLFLVAIGPGPDGRHRYEAVFG